MTGFGSIGTMGGLQKFDFQKNCIRPSFKPTQFWYTIAAVIISYPYCLKLSQGKVPEKTYPAQPVENHFFTTCQPS